MTSRRTFAMGALTVLAASLAAEAQHSGRVHRIGVLAFENSPGWEAFRQSLRHLGYVDGSNTTIEWRWSEGRLERFPNFAAELVSLKVDLIVASTYPGALSAENATKTIPIIMVAVADPVGKGLVASLVRPGGNITGVTLHASMEMVGKYVELLKEVVPTLTRVAILSNPANSMHVLRLKEVNVAGRSLGMQLQVMTAQSPAEFDRAFAAMTRARAGALYVVGDPMFFQHRPRLAELAARSRLPAVYELKGHVEVGGLMAYGPNTVEMYGRAATYVDKILRGAKPGDLPIEQPTKFELVINLKTAKALGLTIPPAVLARANEVIE